MTNNTPTEYQEALTLVDYLEHLKTAGKVLCYSHIPQETYTKSWATKAKNKRQGVRTGVPDYVVVTRDKVLWIELKRSKGGAVSEAQKIWIAALDSKQSRAMVCRGFDEAQRFINYEMEVK